MQLRCGTCDGIIKGEAYFHSGIPYHKECASCVICYKEVNEDIDLDRLFYICPGIFMCPLHHEEYMKNGFIPDYYQSKFRKRILKNFTRQTLCPSADLTDAIQIQKPYELFLPTITFHCDKPLDSVDLDKLQEIVDEFGSIIQIERGSIITKLAIFKEKFSICKSFKKLKENVVRIFNAIKEKFQTALGKSIVGCVIGEPDITIPNEQEIQELFKNSTSNIFQNFDELNDAEFDFIEMIAIEQAQNDDCKTNYKYIIDHKPEYEMAEKQIKNDIELNPYELTAVGSSIIMNKLNKEHESLKNQIPQDQLATGYIYHGTKTSNHFSIAKSFFKNPNVDSLDNIKITDAGYFGKGTYATNNIYYACYYANQLELLKVGQKVSILYCKYIYNKNFVEEKTKVELGSSISKQISKNHGINHAFVGSENHFKPILKADAHKHKVAAEEFVFPEKYMIIPMFSFTIMRRDYFFIWKDENLDSVENSDYKHELCKSIEANAYFCYTVDEAVDLIKLKKRNKIKLITNGGGPEHTGQQLIQEARQIVGSNFVCLVFAGNKDEHINWVTSMENVLFTTNEKMFKKFANLSLDKTKILEFTDELQLKENVKFKINEDQLLNFPNFDKL
ncbi:hypothetical protein M9Y10_000413 [Tritrichomonas musculus]|uniref:LIM zinc-binding domain-containing protein n=1 Tax=Tritrichomonas musculus TaxID=1915356 RepID=A0ABR2L5W2_9EUKA